VELGHDEKLGAGIDGRLGRDSGGNRNVRDASIRGCTVHEHNEYDPAGELQPLPIAPFFYNPKIDRNEHRERSLRRVPRLQSRRSDFLALRQHGNGAEQLR
jgi:hypothetical protein